MATVIDTLVVEFGLDPTKFTKGQQAVIASVQQLNAIVTRHSRQAERAQSGLADSIEDVRGKFLRLGAAILGARSFEQMVVNTVTNTAALGRFSSTLGTSTEMLSRWQNIGKIVTGTTEGMAEAVAGAIKNFAQMSLTGPNSAVPFLNALNIDVRKFLDNKGQLKDVTGYFLALSEKFYEMRNEPGRVAVFAEQLGISQKLLEVLIKGPAAVRAYIAEVDKARVATEKEAQESQEVVEAWGKASLAVQPFVRFISILTARSVVEVLNKLSGIGQNISDIFDKPEKAGVSGVLGDIKGTLVGSMGAGALKGAGGGPVGIIGGAIAGGLGHFFPTSPTAGNQSAGAAALAQGIYSNVPGINRFTAFQDDFHKGRNSAHNEGRAFDFTLKDGSKASYAEAAAKVRAYLASVGVSGTVIDEANFPSPGATAPHLHVQFNSNAAAQRYANAAGAASTSTTTNSRRSETNFNGGINVYTASADPQRVADTIVGAVDRHLKGAAAANAVQ
jgi:hypothetical protein